MEFFIDLQSTAWQVLTMPANALLDPSRRIYWPFLAFSIVVAVLLLALQQRKFSPAIWLQSFFSRRYFLSKSSATDLALWLLNSALRLIAIVPLVGGHLAFTLVIVRFLHGHFNAPDIPIPPPLLMMTLYTLVFLLLEDFSRYGLHRLMHRVPLLWRFHKTHHSATVLTPFTLFRVHPIEMTLYYLRGTLVFGLVSGVFIFLWGGKVSGWQILGVDAIGFIFNLAAANLRHSHIWLSFGWFEKLFISPAQHQLHHSTNPEHFNKNYGSVLALWDRVFGSWLLAGRKPQRLTFGL